MGNGEYFPGHERAKRAALPLPEDVVSSLILRRAQSLANNGPIEQYFHGFQIGL
jgi:hypothetical protein